MFWMNLRHFASVTQLAVCSRSETKQKLNKALETTLVSLTPHCIPPSFDPLLWVADVTGSQKQTNKKVRSVDDETCINNESLANCLASTRFAEGTLKLFNVLSQVS